MIRQLVTKRELLEQFKAMGIREGMVLLVHSSLASFGYVVGGSQTVVDALFEAVGYEGTIIMPMFNRDNSEPSYWKDPAIDHQLMQVIRETTPSFQPKESDCVRMGRVVDNFRRRDGIIFSKHPSSSFAAWGKYAKLICNRHSLHFSLSEESPLARIFELKGYTLLLGVDYTKATILHLAEYRSGIRPIILQGGAVEIAQEKSWKKYLDIELDSSSFVKVGQLLEERDLVTRKTIGEAPCRLFPVTAGVECAEQYFSSLLNY